MSTQKIDAQGQGGPTGKTASDTQDGAASETGRVVPLAGGKRREGGKQRQPGKRREGGKQRQPEGEATKRKAAARSEAAEDRTASAAPEDTPAPAAKAVPAAKAEPSVKPDAAAEPAPSADGGTKPAKESAAKPAASRSSKPAEPPAKRVLPTAPKARMRGRHFVAISTFLIFVILPSLAAGWYLWTRATDQYASYVGFSVRTEETSSAFDILGGIAEIGGSSSSDTDILYEFLQSQALVRQIDEQIDLRGIWSKPGYENDPIFVYDAPGTIEDLEAQWADMVRISYNANSGLIDLRVLAFTPEEAQLIGRTIFEDASDMINELTDIAREDAIRYAREELDTAADRLRAARTAVQEFRNRTQIVDPTIDTAGQMGLVTTLQNQLAEAIIDLDMLAGTTRDGDPRISQAERRIEVIERRIEEERQKVGLAGSGDAMADIVGEYEVLTVDREFAEQAYTAALAAYDSALAEARRQTRYLAAHVQPTLAEHSDFPQRGMTLGFIMLFLALGWSIATLLAYAVRDRR